MSIGFLILYCLGIIAFACDGLVAYLGGVILALALTGNCQPLNPSGTNYMEVGRGHDR